MKIVKCQIIKREEDEDGPDVRERHDEGSLVRTKGF